MPPVDHTTVLLPLDHCARHGDPLRECVGIEEPGKRQRRADMPCPYCAGEEWAPEYMERFWRDFQPGADPHVRAPAPWEDRFPYGGHPQSYRLGAISWIDQRGMRCGSPTSYGLALVWILV